MPPSTFLKLMASWLGSGRLINIYTYCLIIHTMQVLKWFYCFLPLLISQLESVVCLIWNWRIYVQQYQFQYIWTRKEPHLLISFSRGRTIWMDTLDLSASNAWVKTGVVIGIFSIVEFFPKIYLNRLNLSKPSEGKTKETQQNWIQKNAHPATSLKPVDPDNLSPLVSTTTNGLYFLTCSFIWEYDQVHTQFIN